MARNAAVAPSMANPADAHRQAAVSRTPGAVGTAT
jgi:hypothetical protein